MTSPQLSVVVTSFNSAGLLDECLAALESQTIKDGFEVIVVDSSSDGSGDRVAELFPNVRFLPIPYPGSRALMRAYGISQAQGEIVAVTEDHCVPGEDWIERILENHCLPVVAAGGVVENSAEDRADYWAIYFCEYYHFMPPLPGGPVADIPGSNASYKRSALMQTEMGRMGLWDNLINAQLGGDGNAGKILSDPCQLVYHNKREEPFSFLFHRYHYSRCFAGFRSGQVSVLRRLFYLAFSLTLPVLVLGRTFREVWQKGRNRAKLLRSLPFLVPFLISSAVGEFMGYLLGTGSSWRKID